MPWESHLVDFGALAGESIPQNDCTLIIAAGQEVLVITAPADTAANKKKADITLHCCTHPQPVPFIISFSPFSLNDFIPCH